MKPILRRIAERISNIVGKKLDENVVLLLWTRATGVVAVTASGNPDRIKALGEIATLPDLLTQEEVDEITRVGKTIHYRFYVSLFSSTLLYVLKIFLQTEHMENEFPLPNLPRE